MDLFGDIAFAIVPMKGSIVDGTGGYRTLLEIDSSYRSSVADSSRDWIHARFRALSRSRLPGTVHDELGAREFNKAHGTPRVELLCADPDLRAESEFIPVSESG